MTNKEKLLAFLGNNKNAAVVCKLIYPNIENDTINTFLKSKSLYQNFLNALYKDKNIKFTADEKMFLKMLAPRFTKIYRAENGKGLCVSNNDRSYVHGITKLTDLSFDCVKDEPIEFRNYLDVEDKSVKNIHKAILEDIKKWGDEVDIRPQCSDDDIDSASEKSKDNSELEMDPDDIELAEYAEDLKKSLQDYLKSAHR